MTLSTRVTIYSRYYLHVTMSRRTFPTKFVWDHGGREVNLCIVKPEGSETVPLQRSEDGTFEITTSLGQVRQRTVTRLNDRKPFHLSFSECKEV